MVNTMSVNWFFLLHDKDADSNFLPDDSDTKHIYMHSIFLAFHQKFLILKE